MGNEESRQRRVVVVVGHGHQLISPNLLKINNLQQCISTNAAQHLMTIVKCSTLIILSILLIAQRRNVMGNDTCFFLRHVLTFAILLRRFDYAKRVQHFLE